MLRNNLSTIIRWYKGRVTFESHQNNNNFAWQPRFYDHIICDEKSHENIAWYIQNNPDNWEKDDYYAKKMTQN